MELDKVKIKEAMTHYLEVNGWQVVSDPDAFIIRHLKPMFEYLLDKKLVEPDQYKIYEVAATHAYIKAMAGV